MIPEETFDSSQRLIGIIFPKKGFACSVDEGPPISFPAQPNQLVLDHPSLLALFSFAGIGSNALPKGAAPGRDEIPFYCLLVLWNG